MQDIWRKLNNLADSDPLQYHQFVAEQLKHGNDGDIQENNPKSENNRSFRPTSGFCVSSETIGGDGLMIREVANNGRHLSKGKTLFVNICSSLAVEKATDRSGKPVDSASVFRSADGLSIPLIVGAPRDFNFSDGIEGMHFNRCYINTISSFFITRTRAGSNRC